MIPHGVPSEHLFAIAGTQYGQAIMVLAYNRDATIEWCSRFSVTPGSRCGCLKEIEQD